MKAVVQREYGDPDVLSVENVDAPTPGPGEVRIEVRAASVNSWDWDVLRGDLANRALSGPLRPKRSIPGCDVAGRVDVVGEGVADLRPGDDVFGDLSGAGWGCFAEMVCAPAELLAKKPAGMRFEEAAAIPQAGVLALQALRLGGAPREGQTILLNGAGGGVGTFALQMAVAKGALVTCVDKAAKLDLLRDLGAHRVVDYRAVDVPKASATYDVIIDVVGRRSPLAWRRVLAEDGHYVMVGGSLAHILEVAALSPVSRFGLLMHRPNREDLETLGDMFVAGEIDPTIDERSFTLEDVPEALRIMGAGDALGKLVITVRPT